MPRPVPPPLGLTLTILRMAQGSTQEELAAVGGVASRLLSDYEVGRTNKTLTREKLDRFAEILGFTPSTVDEVLALVHRLRPVPSDLPAGLSVEDLREIERMAWAVGRLAAEEARSGLVQALRDQRAQESRQEAGELWERLRSFTPAERLVLVAGGREYQSWAFCELLCRESKRATASDAAQAVEVAELALRVAEQISEDRWSLRVQGYAWAHLGNALRVASDLPGADAAFRRAWELWHAGAAADPGWLPEAQMLSLEASLRRAQRRFPEALDLLERALAGAPPSLAGSIGLNLATSLQLMGEHARAVETLERLAPRVEEQGDPRLLFALRFNLAANLGHLGRHQEAAELLTEVRLMAVQLRNDLDLIRVHWLEGRVAVGQGRREEAVLTFAQVRTEFAALGIGYNAALVSMELAVLYLEDGRTGEVKALAREMAPIFQAQGVHREALAALRLFCETAEQEAVSLEMARRLVHYLERARLDPGLRFE